MSEKDSRRVVAVLLGNVLRLIRREEDVAATVSQADAEVLSAGGRVKHQQIAVEASPRAGSTIDWDSPTWGGGVTYAANGSWVPDRHDRSGKTSH